MRNIAEWKQTKIQHRKGVFSVKSSGVAPGSLYITMEAFRALNLHKLYLHGHLIDLGCGNVPYYEWYKDQVDKITCIDWPGSLHNTKHIEAFADLNQYLPIKTASVECVLLTSVLEHIGKPERLLKETRRILVQDGYLVLSVPFLYHLHEEPFDYYRFTPHGLKRLAKEAGFEVISLKHYGSAIGVFVDVSSKIIESVINAICRFLQKNISSSIRLAGYKILRMYQQFSFLILKQKWALHILDRLGLSQRIALGYVIVLSPEKPRSITTSM